MIYTLILLCLLVVSYSLWIASDNDPERQDTLVRALFSYIVCLITILMVGLILKQFDNPLIAHHLLLGEPGRCKIITLYALCYMLVSWRAVFLLTDRERWNKECTSY